MHDGKETVLSCDPGLRLEMQRGKHLPTSFHSSGDSLLVCPMICPGMKRSSRTACLRVTSGFLSRGRSIHPMQDEASPILSGSGTCTPPRRRCCKTVLWASMRAKLSLSTPLCTLKTTPVFSTAPPEQLYSTSPSTKLRSSYESSSFT